VKGIDTKLSIEIIDISIIDIKRLYIDEASVESGFISLPYRFKAIDYRLFIDTFHFLMM
jgi:hypothetical protein